MLEYAKAAIWLLLLLSNIWGAAPGLSREERVLNNLMVLRATLMAWYTARHAQFPTERLTRVQDLTKKMSAPLRTNA